MFILSFDNRFYARFKFSVLLFFRINLKNHSMYVNNIKQRFSPLSIVCGPARLGVRRGGTLGEPSRRLVEANLLPINSQRDLLIVTPASVVINL